MKKLLSIIVLLALMLTCGATASEMKAGKRGKGKVQLINPDSIPDTHKIFYKTDNWEAVELSDSVFWERKILYNTCNNSGAIIFDGEVTEIPRDAFWGSEITELTLPSSVCTIGEFAFGACDRLQKVLLPAGLKNIKDYAFTSCVKLNSITIPESVESIGLGAFASCYALQKFSGKFASPDGRCLIDGDKLIAIAVKGLKEFTIPANIKTIDMDSASWFTTGRDDPTIIYCKPETPPQCLSEVFSPSSEEVRFASIVYVPAASLELYQNDPNWSRFKIVGYVF